MKKTIASGLLLLLLAGCAHPACWGEAFAGWLKGGAGAEWEAAQRCSAERAG